MRRWFVGFLMVVCMGWMTMNAWSQQQTGEKIKVFAGILPAATFVERVGGERVDVDVLAGPGRDPHTFEPTPKLMAKLSQAAVLFKMGFPFEETLIKKVANSAPKLEIVDLQQGIQLRRYTDAEIHREEGEHGHKHRHTHGKKHEHSHDAGDVDPHSWLDPLNVKIQAKTIAETLSRIDPAGASVYGQNLERFQGELDALHQRLTKALEPVKGKKMYVFHPAYGYFGDRYGLIQTPIEMGGKEPSAKQLAKLIESAKTDGVKVIFVQPQFSSKSAQALAKALGAAVVSLDDLSPRYVENLEEMAVKLEQALSAQVR